MSIRKSAATSIDIRYLSVLPALVGMAMMMVSFVAPGLVWRLYAPYFGMFGFLIHGLLTFAILRFNYVGCLILVKLAYRKILSGASGYVPVEIEPLQTCHKLKLVPDDFGVLFLRGDCVYLRTIRALYSFGEMAKPENLSVFRHKGIPRGLVFRDDHSITDFVMRPVIFQWDFSFHGNFKKRNELFVGILQRWTASTAQPKELPAAIGNPYASTPKSSGI